MELLRHGVPGTFTSDPEPIIERALERLAPNLLDSNDEIMSIVAQTNASAFYPDEIVITSMGTLNLTDVTIPFEGTVHYTGEQDPEHTSCGTSILAQLTGDVQFDGYEWEIKDYQVTAEIERDEEDYNHNDD